MAQLLKGKQIASQTIIISGNTGNVKVSGLLDTNGNQVFVNVLPTLDQHLANKQYVDAVAQGVSPHAPVRVVLTGQTTLSGLLTTDGVTLVSGDSVLVAGQTDKRFNGIYVATGTTWSRRIDADGDPNNEIELGDFVFVESGLTNASSGWVLGKTDSLDMPITPDIDTQEWYKMAAPGSYITDGEGIELNGSIFSLELDGTTLTKGGNGLKLNDTLSTAISTNTVGLSTEVSNRISVDNSLSTSLSTETSVRTSNVTSLTTRVSTEESVRTSNVASLSTAVSTRISVDNSLSTSISTQTSIRTSADTSLTTRISTEESVRTSNVTSLSSSLSTQTSIRTSADTSLTTRISTEESVRTSNVASLSNAITGDVSTLVSTEASIRASADTSLTTRVSTEEVTRLSVDNSLSTSLSTETSIRSSSDTSLTTRVSTEESVRTSTNTSLTTRVSTEEVTRLSVDNSLSTALSTEASVRLSTDASLSNAITGDVSTLVSTEASIRASADTSLTTRVSTEEVTRLSVDNSLSTIVSTEASIRASADTSLTTRVSTEESVRSSVDSSLSTAILEINDPDVVEESFNPSNSGSTSAVVVNTGVFDYGTGVVDIDSVVVFMNGIQYPFAINSGTAVFHLNGTTPTGTAQTLYFSGVAASFGIETDDFVVIKYMVVT